MKKLDTEGFVNKAIEKHGDKHYDYSRVIYKSGLVDVTVGCPIHGDFLIKPQHHLQKSYCPECSKTARTEATLKVNEDKKLSTENWILTAKEIHGDRFGYSNTVYVDARTKVKIECDIHGEQEMLPHHHIKGYGCGKCGKNMINTTNGKAFTQEEFIERVSKIGDYTFENTTYISKRKFVDVTCKQHGSFTTTGELLLKGHGCPKCFIRSKGEVIISKYLTSHNIEFIQEKKFSGCIYKSRLRFDFYLPEFNACIEFDGKQHYKEVLYFGGKNTYEELQIKDIIKNNYCILNNIPLLRIKYDDKDIEAIIEEFIKKLKK